MKRKLFFFIVIAAFFGTAVFFIVSLKTKKDNLFSKRFRNEDLVFFDLNGNDFFPLRMNETVALVYFDSGCDHCRNEIKELNKNCDVFERNTVFLVSDEPVHVLKQVDSTYRISEKAVFTILCDSLKTFNKKFGNRTAPAILLFDKGMLIKEYAGEVSANLISKSLKK